MTNQKRKSLADRFIKFGKNLAANAEWTQGLGRDSLEISALPLHIQHEMRRQIKELRAEAELLLPEYPDPVVEKYLNETIDYFDLCLSQLPAGNVH